MASRNPHAREEPTDNVAALRRGLELLSCLAASGRPLGNAELSEMTGVPRPTVTRLVATLMAMGHVRASTDGLRFELAAGVVRLADAFLGGLDVRAAARPHVIALAEATGATSLLGVRDGLEVMVFEAARSRSAVALLRADVGTRMALTTSALGRAWLAGVDAATRAAVLAQLRKARTRAEPAIDASFERRLEEARALGYATSLGEWNPHIHAVAVPVRTPRGEVISLNCGGPSFLMPAQRLTEVALPALLRHAQALARDIGGLAGRALTQEGVETAAPSKPSQGPPRKRPTSLRRAVGTVRPKTSRKDTQP